MDLVYPPFAASKTLQSVIKGKAVLKLGQKSAAVRLIQAALLQLGHGPVGAIIKGVPDGTFGADTETALKAFQSAQALKSDGIVGVETLAMLDALLAPPSATSKFTVTSFSSTSEYKLGVEDPPYIPDPGAGPWKSKPIEATYLALWATLDLSLATFVVFGKDATNHLRHYLAGSGRDYEIDLESMLRQVPSARHWLQHEITQARSFVELLPVGTHFITSKQLDEGYNRQTENSNWYFALGGYRRWGKGVAKVFSVGGIRRYELDFEYRVRDRYNWDGQKQVEIPTPFQDSDPVIVTDKFMGEFHRQGLAREYFCNGRIKRKLSWSQGLPIPYAQMTLAAGGGG